MLGCSTLISSLGATKKPVLSLKSFLKTITDPAILVINCGGRKADQHVTMRQFYKLFLEWLLTKVIIQYEQILLETRNKSRTTNGHKGGTVAKCRKCSHVTMGAGQRS